MLQPITCPHCGAPVQIPPGQPMFNCPYCHRQFATPAHLAAPPQQAQGPTFIIVHGPGHDDDDDDDDHHAHHPQLYVGPHIVASGMSSWLTWVIVCVVISLVAGGGGAFAWFSKHSSLASGLVWDGSGPFHCGGNEQINVTGVTATFNAGTAISVDGNCHFTCTDCSIKAPTAIESGGNGVVTMVNGSVIGTEVMVDAGGNSRVNISGNVTASGEVKKSMNAKVSAPKSVATAAAPAAPAPTPTAPAAAAAVPAAKPAVPAKPAAKASPKAPAKK